MKRSDIIQHMLNTWAHLHMGGWSEGTDEQRMVELLAELEACGMRPPCSAGFGGHGKLDKQGSCDDYIESCHFEWEKEDKPKHECGHPDCKGYNPEKDK